MTQPAMPYVPPKRVKLSLATGGPADEIDYVELPELPEAPVQLFAAAEVEPAEELVSALRTQAEIREDRVPLREAPLREDHDPVNAPSHYRQHPSGVECIEITQHMLFTLGNAFKYIWRADFKWGTEEGAIEDLRKAIWYIEREIALRTGEEG